MSRKDVTADAVKAIATAAAEASKVIADAAAEALKVKNAQADNDHDILTSFRAETIAELKNIRNDINKLSDGTSDKLADNTKRIEALELCKIDPEEHKNLMSRVDKFLIVIGLYTLFTLGLASLVVYHILRP
jgi:predicted phage-related endonuclease